MHELNLSDLNGPNSANSMRQDESDSSRLNTPQFFGISPTLTAHLLGNNGGLSFNFVLLCLLNSLLIYNLFVEQSENTLYIKVNNQFKKGIN